MKIRCKILRKNRAVQVLNISENDEYFTFNEAIYLMFKDAVNLTVHLDGSVNPTPELVYIEGNPIPLTVKDEGQSLFFLDQIVMNKVLETASEPKGMLLEVILSYAKNPVNILILLFVVIIAVAVTQEWINLGAIF